MKKQPRVPWFSIYRLQRYYLCISENLLQTLIKQIKERDLQATQETNLVFH